MKNRVVKEFETKDDKKVFLVFLEDGLSDNLVEQLLEHSANDEVVREFSSDAKRFASMESYNKWKKKGRIIYIVTDESRQKLLGFYWFGFKPISKEQVELNEENKDLKVADFNITMAYRLYEGLRGKRMFTKTFAETLRDLINSDFYKKQKAQNKGNLWTDTRFDNTNSIKALKKLGFKIIGKYLEKSGRAMAVCRDEDLLINK